MYDENIPSGQRIIMVLFHFYFFHTRSKNMCTTLFRFITMLCRNDIIPRNMLRYCPHSVYPDIMMETHPQNNNKCNFPHRQTTTPTSCQDHPLLKTRIYPLTSYQGFIRMWPRHVPNSLVGVS